MPIPLPNPQLMCTFTTPGLREAWANPSAMATTGTSWSPRMYLIRGWSTRASERGSSVVPGLPNRYRTPDSARISSMASQAFIDMVLAIFRK